MYPVIVAPFALTEPFGMFAVIVWLIKKDIIWSDVAPDVIGLPAGVTADVALDGELSPTAFVAVTLNVYAVPFVRPVTTADVLDADASFVVISVLEAL